MKQVKITITGDEYLEQNMKQLQERLDIPDNRDLFVLAFAVLDMLSDHEMDGGKIHLTRDGQKSETISVLKAAKKYRP